MTYSAGSNVLAEGRAGAQERYLEFYDARKANEWGRFSFPIDYWKDNTALVRNAPQHRPPEAHLGRVVQERLSSSEEGQTTEKKKRKDGERREKVRNYSVFHH